ncbi:MAG: hypothetical protein AAF198_07465 [Pseudomonadota bacterium]
MSDTADAKTLGKARLFHERFREVISDPLNLLIERVPEAGYFDEAERVILHNGLTVASGDQPGAYYGKFSELLVFNRGVHEPLEEFCFQEFLKLQPPPAPVMIELGAYWAHYSMWFQSRYQNGRTILVEPNDRNLRAGEMNYTHNGFEGTFINAFVGHGHFGIDEYCTAEKMDEIYLLHSDIQGYEVEMLDDAAEKLEDHKISYLFVSTHGPKVLDACLSRLSDKKYDIEVVSEPREHTTSTDGFILASAPNVSKVFNAFSPMGRIDIAHSTGPDHLTYLNGVHQNRLNDDT